MKSCKRCSRNFPLTLYSPHKAYPDGLEGICRLCKKQAIKRFSPLMQEQYRLTHYPYGKKKCTKCKEHHDFSEFSYRVRHMDGMSYVCKPCASKINKPWFPPTVAELKAAEAILEAEKPTLGKEKGKRILFSF